MFSTQWPSFPRLCIPTVTKSTASGAMHLEKPCISVMKYAHEKQEENSSVHYLNQTQI